LPYSSCESEHDYRNPVLVRRAWVIFSPYASA
jgi:hypothetical protein